jgi:hypothetical protein
VEASWKTAGRPCGLRVRPPWTTLQVGRLTPAAGAASRGSRPYAAEPLGADSLTSIGSKSLIWNDLTVRSPWSRMGPARVETDPSPAPAPPLRGGSPVRKPRKGCRGSPATTLLADQDSGGPGSSPSGGVQEVHERKSRGPSGRAACREEGADPSGGSRSPGEHRAPSAGLAGRGVTTDFRGEESLGADARTPGALRPAGDALTAGRQGPPQGGPCSPEGERSEGMP